MEESIVATVGCELYLLQDFVSQISDYTVQVTSNMELNFTVVRSVP